MGIEPTRKVVPDLENKQFGAITNAKCDGRVNFRGMWGHVRTQGYIGARDPGLCLPTISL
jgi:hypothetical protein